MFIAPFVRLSQQDQTAVNRLGTQEAARQAALLRTPGDTRKPVPAPLMAVRFQNSLRREGWNDGCH
jgi:hypothetical protein